MSMPVAEGMVVVLVGDGRAWNGGGKGRPVAWVLRWRCQFFCEDKMRCGRVFLASLQLPRPPGKEASLFVYNVSEDTVEISQVCRWTNNADVGDKK